MARFHALPTASRLGRPLTEEQMRHLRENITREGFHVTRVPFRNGSDVPEYSYTTGLVAACRHPELLIVGFVPSGEGSSYDVLRKAAKWVLGGSPSVSLRYAWPAGRVGFRPVDAGRCVLRFPASEAFYGDAVPVHQVLWADKDGRLPGEPGCDPHVGHRQDLRGNAAAYLTANQPRAGAGDSEPIPYTVFFEFPESTVEDAVNSLRMAGHLAAADPIKGTKGWWKVQAAAPRNPAATPSAWSRPWEHFAAKFGGKATGGEATLPGRRGLQPEL